jgi:hypothetical protein
MTNLNKLLERMPDNYNKAPNSNVTKLLSLIAHIADEEEKTLELIRAWRDVDQAQGVGLDRIGGNVGQPRNGMNDEEYRNRIKVKIRANLSGGEIETINAIARVFVGERYTGLDEGWTLPADFPIPPEEAMVLLTVLANGVNFGIPAQEIESVKGGGVRVNWELQSRRKVDVEENVAVYEQPYLMCGTFTAGEELVL